MSIEDLASRAAEQISASGIEVGIPARAALKTTFTIAAGIRFDETSDARITQLEVRFAPPPPPRKTCADALLYDLAGFGNTGPQGAITMRIWDFLCFGLRAAGEDEVWVVGTPRSSEAAFLTHVVLGPDDFPGPGPQPDPHDLYIRFLGWDAAGQPKPNVPFTWRALIRFERDVVE